MHKYLMMLFGLLLVSQVMAQPADFELTNASLGASGVFADEQIANGFGCAGGNISPELSWTGAPEGTLSYGVTILDMDAPTGSGFWHWVMFNIPADETSLAAGAGDPTANLAPEGSIQSRNDAGLTGYVGACPPLGRKPHRYQITLYALGTENIPLDETASGALAGFYLNGNALATSSITALYAQPTGFELTSASVGEDGAFAAEQIASVFGCTGGNVSPELSWTGAPEGTLSYGVTILDMDAPTGSGFWHWVMFNIPATETSLVVGAGDPAAGLAPEGSVQSLNDAGLTGYLGSCPPAGNKPHRYLITLYALGTENIALDETASGALVGFFLNSSALATTTLVVTYGR